MYFVERSDAQHTLCAQREEEEETVVEPMLSHLQNYQAETIAILFQPLMILFIKIFAEQVRSMDVTVRCTVEGGDRLSLDVQRWGRSVYAGYPLFRCVL